MAITAKNYAAQAERGILQWADAAEKQLPIDSFMVKSVFSQIKTAVHFVIPDDGIIFDDGQKGLKNTELRLPFPVITVEYFVTYKEEIKSLAAPQHSPKRVILAMDIDEAKALPKFAEFENGGVVIFCANVIDGMWLPCTFGLVIPRKWDEPGGSAFYEALLPAKNGSLMRVTPIVLCHEIFGKMQESRKENEKQLIQELMHDISQELTALLELCEALSCSNVSSETTKESALSSLKNAGRIKKGKLPIYETRQLVIIAPQSKNKSHKQGLIQDRNAPREHLRRGHIRTISDGKKVWVQSCVVGSKNIGTIVKSYQVKS